jgi:AraC-like DNA-binding protein
MGMLPELKLNDPCGRIYCGSGWSRTRENSLSLRDLEFWLVWKGRGWMRTKDREFELLPGFCTLMRPGGIYDAGHDEKDQLGITFVHFKCKDNENDWRHWPEFLGIRDVDYLDVISKRVVELFTINPRVGAQLLRVMLMDLFQKQSANKQETFFTHQAEILQMVRGIHAAEHLPSVALMAERLHVSTPHFSRIFKNIVGQGPMEFLLQIRLSRARHLLRETNMSIGEIADRLDYTDVFFFSRQFKEKCGVSPLEFRKIKD